jgi:hypothetical protein
MPLTQLVAEYTTGDGNTWAHETAHLETIHPDKLARIRTEITAGHFPPVPLDHQEKRAVDGHHRVVAALQLGLDHVPVVDAWADASWMDHPSVWGADDR